jgi:sulfate permease, SulP family
MGFVLLDLSEPLEAFSAFAAWRSIHQPTGRDIRLVTFAPETVFGEIAILDAGPRSASIIADDDFVSYALSQEQFVELSSEAPAIAIKLLANLGRELSGRLRRADRMIDEIEI